MNNKEIKLAIENKEYNKLYKEFTPVIKSLVRRYPTNKQDDLKQEGYIALHSFLNKANKYSPRCWKSFIRQFLNSRIIEAVRKDTGLIKIPYHITSLIKKLKQYLVDNDLDILDVSEEELVNVLKCKPNYLRLAKRYMTIEYVSYELIQERDINEE